MLSQLQVPATPAGYADLLAWASEAAGGQRLAWAIEGTRHYGLGLARQLAVAGQQVAEIDGTRHIGKRRSGKSDPIDAVRAARELLARPRPGQLRADGDREALRLLMTDRDNAIQSAKTARTVLTSVIVTAPAQLREELRHLPRERRARACAELACPAGADRLKDIRWSARMSAAIRICPLAVTAMGRRSSRKVSGFPVRRPAGFAPAEYLLRQACRAYGWTGTQIARFGAVLIPVRPASATAIGFGAGACLLPAMLPPSFTWRRR